MRPFALALLLFAAGALASAEDPAQPAAEFRPSKYAGRELYRAVRAAAPGMRADAVEAIRLRLGIDYADRGTIRVRFQDLAPEGSPSRTAEMAERLIETVDGKPVIVIVLYWEYLMTGLADARVELTHEFFHAVHREQLSMDAYVALPRWVREGLAMYVAEQGPERIRYILADKIDQGPNALIRGLEMGSHNLDSYAEDCLAFQYLEDQYGVDKLRAIAADIVFGRREPHEAIRAATGEDWATFADHAQRYARSAVRLAENGVRERYLPALERYLKSDFAAAAEGFRALLAAEPDSYAAGLAQYYLARCEFQLKRFDVASDAFRITTAKYAGRIGLIDESQYYLGLCAFERKEWSDALRELRVFLRDYPYGYNFAEARLYAGRSQIELDRPAEALDLLLPLLAKDERSSVAAPTRAALAELMKRYPASPAAAAARKKLEETEAGK